MKDKKGQILEKMGNNFITMLTVLFTLQIANFLSVYIFKKSFIVPTVALFFSIFIVFGVFKDFAKEKPKKTGFLILKISAVIFVFSLINHLMSSVAFSLSDTNKQKSLFNMSYFLNFAMSIAIVSLYRKDSFKKILDNIYETSILAKLNINISNNANKNIGDVQLCIDKETNKPVILPIKDRYLHMLVLGPTGCGKTSQIILPMINQDMQNLDCGITVIEPKSDLAEKVYAMAVNYGRKAIYFNPILPNCPYFNPLYGREEDVIENMATTFKMLNPDSPQFFLDMNENLLRNSLKVLKRLFGNKATLIELARLIQNSGGVGRKMVMSFSRLNARTEAIAKENTDIASWFLNEYFNEQHSKTYEHCSGLRSQVAKITANKYLRRVLNPPDGMNDIDFEKHLEEGGVISIATPQGELGDLSRYLGYFIILQFQSAVFKRPGNENTRKAHFLYIDEFQVYSNPGFANMLTQGRSYRVASHLATQNRALMAMGGGRDGKNFVELVSTNARNVVIFPGGNALDAKYYSDQFGEIMKVKIRKSTSKAKFNPLYGIQRINYPNESINESEEMEARFSPSDIIYKKFGEITYCIIQNNTVQFPGSGKVDWIPYELNKKLDDMIEEFKNNEFAREDEEEEFVDPQELSPPQPVINNVPVIKDPIASSVKPVKDPLANQMKKPKVVAEPEEQKETTKPQTIDDLPEEDNFDFFEGNTLDNKSSTKKATEKNPIIAPKQQKKTSEFDFMKDDEDELI